MSDRRDRDDALLDDVRQVMGEPRAPQDFHRRLHEAVDAGFLDPPRARRRWPVVLIVAAAVAAALAAVVAPRLLARRAPAEEPEALQMRSGEGAPLAVDMSVLAVAGDAETSTWVHAGDEIEAGTWLRFRVEAPPGIHLALARTGADGDTEVFYRWPEDGGSTTRVARDGDIWYSVEERAGEQTFVCLASDSTLDDTQVAAAAGGADIVGVRIKRENLPVVVME